MFMKVAYEIYDIQNMHQNIGLGMITVEPRNTIAEHGLQMVKNINAMRRNKTQYLYR
jgi:hypothetical protein